MFNALLLLPCVENNKIDILVLFKGDSGVGELAPILLLLVAKSASLITISISTTTLAITMRTTTAGSSYPTLLANYLLGVLLVVLCLRLATFFVLIVNSCYLLRFIREVLLG